MKKGFSKVAWLAFVLLTMTSLVLISYSGDTATTAPKSTALKTSTPKMTPKYGGTLVVRQNMPIGLGYPAKLTAFADLDAAPICTDSLIRFDKSGKPIPWLATAWKYSSDLKSLALTLRKGVKFHDGTDFNAAAVKTNLDLCLAAKRGELASVSSVDVIDTYTVRLNLTKIDAFLLTNLAEWVGIMISPAALAKGEDWCRTNPVGTGPFKQVSYQSGVSVKFEKWDGYWQKGKPYLDAVQIVNIPNDMTATAAFKKDEIHIMNTEDTPIAMDLKDVAKVATLPVYMVLNFDSAHKDSPFADIKVRQAVAYALDTHTLANSFGAGFWTANNQITSKSTPYYNSNVVGCPYNLQKAKEVLEASSYPKGFKTDFMFGTVSNHPLIATAIQSMLAKIGIEMTLKPMTSAATTKLRIDGWQNGAYMVKFTTSTENEPGRYMQTSISKDSIQYRHVARSAEYDAILSKLIAEPDFNKRVALNQQLLKQMFDGECMVAVAYQGANFYIKSLKLNSDDRGDNFIHQWQPEDAWFNE
jgi:peptide/nickel transport system substrate-binding protein